MDQVNFDKTFGVSLEAAKQGKLIARFGWNGKGMFVFQRPADEIKIGVIGNIRSLPQAVKDYFANEDLKETGSEQGLRPIKFSAYLCLKAVDGSIVNGWLPSTTDMLASDWGVL